jgi:hypothetical protein
MKNLRSIFILLIVVLVPSVVSLAGDPLNFKDFAGPTEILFGPVYTYSILVEGSFEEIGWSANGGDVRRVWWEGNRYFCEVQWRESSSDNPARLKVWGKDKESGEVKAERFYFSEQAKKRSLDFRSLRSEGGKCLDVHIEDLVKDGGRVQIWKCNNEIQQRWKFDNKGRLVNESGKCLDIHVQDLKKDGGKVQIWECNDQIQQQWKLDKKGRLVSKGGKCLDVEINEINKDGGKVQIWECNDQIQQRWKFVD